MSNIQSYNDLLVEKQRLTLLLNERKILLETEYEEIKTSLKPIRKVIDFVGKFTSKDSHNPLFTAGMDMGVNLLLKNVVLRNASWIIKLLMPAMVKNYLSHEVDEVSTVFSKIGNFIKRKIKRHQQE